MHIRTALSFLEVIEMETNTRNYHAHGGAEWVIGGKLTFLPGATVEGAEGLFDLPSGVRAGSVPDSTATTVSALRDDFNRLLAALRTAGLLAAAPVAESITDNATPEA